jgi:predicted transcriptional regulator
MTTLKQRHELLKQLVSRRVKVGLTQDKLAETIRNRFNTKISVVTISRIERGTLNTKYDTLYQMNLIISEHEKNFKNQKNSEEILE